MDLESLFSKHTKYLLNILQQIIQSRRFKDILTILEVVSKNTKEWIRINLCTDQVNYTTKSQVHTTTNARIAKNKSINQGGKIADDQCHNTHQELILSNTVTESDIYNNYSYTSYNNWEIEKTAKTAEILTRTDRPKRPLLSETDSNSKTSQATLLNNISDTRLYKLTHALKQRLMNRLI